MLRQSVSCRVPGCISMESAGALSTYPVISSKLMNPPEAEHSVCVSVC